MLPAVEVRSLNHWTASEVPPSPSYPSSHNQEMAELRFQHRSHLMPVCPGTSVLPSLSPSFPIRKVRLLLSLPCGGHFESSASLGMCVKDFTQRVLDSHSGTRIWERRWGLRRPCSCRVGRKNRNLNHIPAGAQVSVSLWACVASSGCGRREGTGASILPPPPGRRRKEKLKGL